MSWRSVGARRGNAINRDIFSGKTRVIWAGGAVSVGAGARNRWSAESVAEYRPISRPMIGACKPKR